MRLGPNGWVECRPIVFNVVPELRPLIKNVKVWLFSDSDDDDWFLKETDDDWFLWESWHDDDDDDDDDD